MAGQSAKKQVASNFKKLKEIHILTWGSLTIFGILTFWFNRPSSSKPFVIFSIPSILCVLIVEKFGRPQVDATTGKIIRLGQDLSAPGVTEALFDVIYITVLLQILAFVFGSNKVWWLYLSIPTYAGYQLWGFIKMGLGMLGFGKKKAAAQPQEGDDSSSQDQQKSKRQQKRELRGEKPKMRYR